MTDYLIQMSESSAEEARIRAWLISPINQFDQAQNSPDRAGGLREISPIGDASIAYISQRYAESAKYYPVLILNGLI
jgi:hypothetical protein